MNKIITVVIKLDTVDKAVTVKVEVFFCNADKNIDIIIILQNNIKIKNKPRNKYSKIFEISFKPKNSEKYFENKIIGELKEKEI